MVFVYLLKLYPRFANMNNEMPSTENKAAVDSFVGEIVEFDIRRPLWMVVTA